jgi:pimeloyl-ACP methyl ester carboxylesterase
MTRTQPIVVIKGGDAFMRRPDPAADERDLRRIQALFPGRANIRAVGYELHDDFGATVERVGSLIREGGEAVVLAGISFGGLVATRVAEQHPDLVSRLILISSAHRFSDEGVRRVRAQIAGVEQRDFMAMAKPFLTLFRRPWLNALVRFGLWRKRHSLDASMNEPAAIIPMLEAGLRAASEGTAHLGGIRAPTLIVGGTADQFFDRSAFEETARAIPSATLVLLDRETHTVPVERPRMVAAAIGAFL